MLGEYLVYYNDKAYIVVRTIKESSNPIISVWKEHLGCDVVLKREGVYYFCKTVIDIEDETTSQDNLLIKSAD